MPLQIRIYSNLNAPPSGKSRSLFHLGGSFEQLLKPYFTLGEASSSCLNLISLWGKLRAVAQTLFHFGGSFEQLLKSSFNKRETSG
ncbi:hypothetical protein ACFFUE_01245 [Bergeyella porcorum]|uniref:hypothetical protein n=1 Tax=Bergeyella porcorum TaxID=1735111 RepID=UPI0035E7E426